MREDILTRESAAMIPSALLVKLTRCWAGSQESIFYHGTYIAVAYLAVAINFLLTKQNIDIYILFNPQLSAPRRVRSVVLDSCPLPRGSEINSLVGWMSLITVPRRPSGLISAFTFEEVGQALTSHFPLSFLPITMPIVINLSTNDCVEFLAGYSLHCPLQAGLSRTSFTQSTNIWVLRAIITTDISMEIFLRTKLRRRSSAYLCKTGAMLFDGCFVPSPPHCKGV